MAQEVQKVVDRAVADMWLDVVGAVQQLEERELVLRLAQARGVDPERP